MRKLKVLVALFIVSGLFLPFVSSSNAWEVIYDVRNDKIMLDSSYNPASFVPGVSGDYYLLGSHGDGLAVLMHLSPMGEVLWMKNFSLSQKLPLNLPYGQGQVIQDIAVGKDGIYVVLMTANVLNVSAPSDWEQGDPLFTLVKFDFSGNPVWARAFKNSKGGYKGIRTQPTGDGAIVMAPIYAHMHRKNPDDPSDSDRIASNLDVGAIKFDGSGNLEWVHIYGREGISEYVWAVGFDGNEVVIAYSTPRWGLDLGLIGIDPETGNLRWVREYKQAVEGSELWKMGRFFSLSGSRPMLYSVPGGWLYTNGLPGKYDDGASIWMKLDKKGNVLWSGFWNTTLPAGQSPQGFALTNDGNYVFFHPLVKTSPSGDIIKVYYDIVPSDHYIARSGEGFVLFITHGPDRFVKLGLNMEFAGYDVHYVAKGGEPGRWVLNIMELGGDDVKFVKVPFYAEGHFEESFEFDDLPTWEWYKVAPVKVWAHDHPNEYFHIKEACNQTGGSATQSPGSSPIPTSSTSTVSSTPSSTVTSTTPSSTGSFEENIGKNPSSIGSHSISFTCGPGIIVALALLPLFLWRRRG
ncbi:CGP-CTERM sorting domain-containing protein [Thermococcus sp.]|uniref:CGP-CTERM sorting domain-containing protein n=1 Tax=Thermococcus sp. TaxID=35749 RepID=UPI00262849EB|nr:CGP-CTERM sorting domain-containing protein [Thermococcus sp.]